MLGGYRAKFGSKGIMGSISIVQWQPLSGLFHRPPANQHVLLSHRKVKSIVLEFLADTLIKATLKLQIPYKPKLNHT